MLACLGLGAPRLPLHMAVGLTPLMVLGHFIAPRGGVTPGAEFANRVIAIVVVWLSAVLVARHLRLRQARELRVREDLTARDNQDLARLHEVGEQCIRAGAPVDSCLSSILDTAIALTGAAKGILQLKDPRTGAPSIIATRGFGQPFQQSHAQALEIPLEAGEHAVQSTPLVSSTGAILGVLATHFARPHHLDERQQRLLDLLTWQAANFLERKQSENALEKSEARLGVATRAAELGIYDYSVPEGIAVWDTRTRELWGVGPTEPVTYEMFMSRVHPEDRDLIHAAVEHASGPSDGGHYAAEYRLVDGANGSTRWIATAGTVFRESGRAVRLVGTVQDITARRNAEEALRASEQQLQIGLEIAHAGTYDCNLENLQTHWSQGHFALLGLAPETVTPNLELWRRHMHPDDLQRIEAIVENAIRTNGRYSAEYRVITAAGTERWLQGEGVVLARPGEPRRLIGATVDVTRYKEAQRELQEADRRKDRFLATLSHELRNPLAPICNATAVLAAPRLESGQLQWARQVIQRQVAHLAQLLDDLLDLARFTQGKLELKPERVALTGVIDSAIETARPAIDSKKHHLVVRLPDEAVALMADPLRLSQVISNLLTNAAKYTDPGGQIELAAKAENGSLVVSVTDDGIGIPPGALEHIFTMFAQVGNSTARSEGGLGIGLALVKGIVELHGGTTEARSSGVGSGSEFVVRIPLVVTDQGSSFPLKIETPATAANSLRVLVADDNADTADSVALLLSLEGYAVQVAHDGAAALLLAETFRPVIALLDLGMPRLDGYGTAQALRAAPWGKSMHLIAVTGWGQDEDKRRSRAAGFDAHLTKPVDPAQLKAMLLWILESRTAFLARSAPRAGTRCHA